MDAQRQKSGGGRRRRRKARNEPRKNTEPVLIAARRPNSPVLSDNGRKLAAASAAPSNASGSPGAQNGTAGKDKRRLAQPQKRSARIIQVAQGEHDEREKRRMRLLDRLLTSEGRGAISRAAEAYLDEDFEFPHEQDVQLQLLEHFNEARAREAIEILVGLLERESPIKLPILSQRLRRLEEYADEAQTRESAAALRRSLRA